LISLIVSSGFGAINFAGTATFSVVFSVIDLIISSIASSSG